MNRYRAISPVTPPQPKVSPLYIRELDAQREPQTSYFRSFRNRIFGQSQGSRPVGQCPLDFAVDPVGYNAVYGLHELQGIHGQVYWGQFYGTWNRVG
jgi:hypothetical protein